MLRPTAPADTDALVALAAGTGVFKPHELVALREVLDDYHEVNHTFGHTARTWDEAGIPLGFVYYAPTAMTDRTWELWWIAVDRTQQGRGLGRVMLDHVEADVRRNGGRVLLIETSSLPHYDPTRRFYLKNRYVEAARIPDFYADGDDKVIFAKRMAPTSA
jgi:ribosomal protein S18 acetylase RimI-like enzyme